MVKKVKVVSSEKLEMNPLFTDTTCNREGVTSLWEAMYNILEEEQPRFMETRITVDRCDYSDASMLDMTCLFFHRIFARLKIIPYINMVKWFLNEADIWDREFKMRSQEVIGSFTLDNLRLMYHLPEPHIIYNRHFVEMFSKENDNRVDYTLTWSNNEEKIKKDKNGMYTTLSVCPPHSFAAAMLCRLFCRPDSTKFSP